MIYKFFKKLLGIGKEKKLYFPVPSIIIDYSEVSKEDGIECDENKIIYRFFYNKYNRICYEKSTYTEEKLNILKKIYNCPVWDNTNEKIKLPVYSRSTPGIIKYISNE